MDLNFITITGKSFKIRANPQNTVEQVKEQIASENQLIAKNLEFFINSARLPNESKINNLNIRDSVILLHNTNQYVDRQIQDTSFVPQKIENQSLRRPEDPPEFDSQILLLTELGFEPQRCAEAFRQSHYDLNAAAEILTNYN